MTKMGVPPPYLDNRTLSKWTTWVVHYHGCIHNIFAIRRLSKFILESIDVYMGYYSKKLSIFFKKVVQKYVFLSFLRV